MGDAGGGYFLSVQALRLILREYDLHRGEAQFTADILRALSLNSRDELVRWAQNADKMEIATMAPIVFEAATKGDANAVKIIEEGTGVLSEYTEEVSRPSAFARAQKSPAGRPFSARFGLHHAFSPQAQKRACPMRVWR